jgi:UDP-N-acetylglucosamine pyrophosphorylase
MICFVFNSVSKESMVSPGYLVTKVLHLFLLNVASLTNNEKHAFFTVLHTKYISTNKIYLFIDKNQPGMQVFANLSSIPCFIYIH